MPFDHGRTVRVSPRREHIAPPTLSNSVRLAHRAVTLRDSQRRSVRVERATLHVNATRTGRGPEAAPVPRPRDSASGHAGPGRPSPERRLETSHAEQVSSKKGGAVAFRPPLPGDRPLPSFPGAVSLARSRHLSAEFDRTIIARSPKTQAPTSVVGRISDLSETCTPRSERPTRAAPS